MTPVGPFAILDSSVDPLFIDTKNRPVLIQTFEEVATGERFTVAVNHLKSKGSSCADVGDPGLGDGSGNCNVTRTNAAIALANYLATDPTGSGDPDFLIIGDLNAYAMEDPIAALTGAGYTDLINAFGGPTAYSFVFDGQLGYLDHALANASMLSQVTGVTEWHINADEVNLFDYNDEIEDAGEADFERESAALPIYEANAFRSSDHDPLVVGLQLAAPVAPTCDQGDAPETIASVSGSVVKAVGNDGPNYFLVTPQGSDLVVQIDTAYNGVSPSFDLAETLTNKSKIRIVACQGDDIIDISALTSHGNNVDGGEGDDEVFGGAGRDIIRTGDGNDTVNAGAGNDNVDGGGDDDVINGEAGNDTLKGGKGNDSLNGGMDKDKLSGGAGDDELRGGDGDDNLLGQGGDDDLYGEGGNDKNNCGSGKGDTVFGPEPGEVVKKCEFTVP